MRLPPGRRIRFMYFKIERSWEIIHVCILFSGFQGCDKQLFGLEQLLSAPGLKGPQLIYAYLIIQSL